jgi:hypothetical protein
MGLILKADAAEKDENSNFPLAAAKDLAAKKGYKEDSDKIKEATGKTGCVMEGEERRKKQGKAGGCNIEERWFLHERLTGKGGDNKIAGIKDICHKTKTVGLVCFPGIMAQKARKNPGNGQYDNQQEYQPVGVKRRRQPHPEPLP